MNVSAIMPTRGRPEFARQALDCFLAQDYPGMAELVILDDEDDPSFPEVPGDPRVRYHRKERLTIAKKRNWLCEQATSELVAHFDSDDYSAPGRISQQVRLLEESGKDFCAFHSILFYSPARGAAARYFGAPGINLGSTYLYRKTWWAAHRFPEVSDRGKVTITGEDGVVKDAQKANRLISVDGTAFLVAREHNGVNGNTSKKSWSTFRPVELSALPAGFPR